MNRLPERCPTNAWDMVKFDLLMPYAGQVVHGNAAPKMEAVAR